MKIKRITLFNIGPYVEENTFDFTVSKNRNIVLIGGKNGAGKTTFFKSIKTCLYGCKVWGYDAPGKEYYSIINSLVNVDKLYDSTAKAYVEIELVFDDGKQTNSYVLHREWMKVKMALTEFFNVRKNGEVIIGTEEDDFINYLLSIIPPDMFNFYFFDGESIAEFFLGSDGGKNFRNAFLKLYGLDTLSIMIDNFSRHVKKGESKASGKEAFDSAKKHLEISQEQYDKVLQDIKEIEEKIEFLRIKIQSLQATYSKEGGVGLVEWKEINAQLAKEENDRDSMNRWLREVANHYLPFVIMENNLRTLANELIAEQEQQKSSMLLDTLNAPDVGSSISKFLDQKSISQITSNDLVDFLTALLQEDTTEPKFDFSASQMSRIMAQIYEKLDFDKTQVRRVLSKLNSSLNSTKKLRDKLAASSIDGYEEFFEQKESYEKEISELLVLLERKKQEAESKKEVVLAAEKEFAKAKENYEAGLKNKSINNLSARGAAAYTMLEEKLVLRQGRLLQDEFVRCFNAIINKDNFIDGIVIDRNINIIPYKFVRINRTQLDNYRNANKEFLGLFDGVKYALEMNKLECGEVKSVMLPSPIKVPFSQGERQVYIMSIYLALLKTSHKDIPFFIDTPFARIDSNHRQNIVDQFFCEIKNQMFILSTDEEIVGEYRQRIDSRISDKYVLEISNYGTTRVVANKYFGE